MKGKLRTIWRRFTADSGQGTVEYILIIGLIVLFIVFILIFFRDEIIEFLKGVIESWLQYSTPS